MTLPIPTNTESVAWAEEADRLANALRDLLKVVEADDLIPESASYMRRAREVMENWPEIPEHLLTPSSELATRLTKETALAHFRKQRDRTIDWLIEKSEGDSRDL